MPRRKAKESSHTKAVIEFFCFQGTKNLNRANYKTDKRIGRVVTKLYTKKGEIKHGLEKKR